MYDRSNALMVAIANHASHDVIRYLIEVDCDVNAQSLDVENAWSQFVTYFPGFSPLLMAVNMQDYESIEMLLKAGADTELFTSTVKYCFPIPSSGLLEVQESRGGHRFKALHLAVHMKQMDIIRLLLHKGHADPNARVCNGINVFLLSRFESGNFEHPLKSYLDGPSSIMTLNTPLHLCDCNDEIAKVLIQNNACLLTQNIKLEASWERHEGLLDEWLQGDALDLKNTVIAVCKAKCLPSDISLHIAEFYVSLHITDHLETACKQELLYSWDHSSTWYFLPNWSWIALTLTYHLEKTYKEDISSELSTSPWIKHGLGILKSCKGFMFKSHERDEELLEFVSSEWKKMKMINAKQLFSVVCSKLFALDLVKESGNNEEEFAGTPAKRARHEG